MKTDQLGTLAMSAAPRFAASRTIDAKILYDADIPAVVASVDASTNAGEANEFATFIASPETAAILRAHRHELAN